MTALRLPRSLQARTLILSGIATALALALAGWSIAGVLNRFVTGGLDRRLDAEISLLASTVDATGRVDRALLGQRVGALEAGPGWRWRIVAPGTSLGSADFPPLDPGPPPPPDRRGPPGDHPDPLRDDRIRAADEATQSGVPLHARQLTLRTAGGPVTLTAAAPRDVVRRPLREAIVPLLLTLGTLAVLLSGAALLQLRWGLRPLRRLRDDVAAIRAGRREKVDENQPAELRPLALELNQLTADNAATLAAARLSAANLAHALKTPVATLALTLRDQPEPAAQIARIDATIRHHLARARMAAIDRRAVTALEPAVNDLVAAIRRLHDQRELSIAVDVAADLVVAVDPNDLDELAGNLLDNAARHAAGHVRVTAALDPADRRRVRIEVADDGPSIPMAQRTAVIQPGRRLDERGDGHGFGITIVSELAALYGGTLELADAPEGGLLVLLTLPTAGARASRD